MDLRAYQSLASVVQGYVDKGFRKLLVTSSGPREGKSTVAAHMARALAETSGQTVLLVDTDPFRPSVHKIFRIENHRGVSDLLREVYLMDLNGKNNGHGQFDLGDWVDLLRAQVKSGRLLIRQDNEEFSILFARGRISSLCARARDESGLLGNLLVQAGRITEEQKAAALRVQEQGRKRLGDVLHGLGYVEPGDLESALQRQLKERLQQIVTLRRAQFQFNESAQSSLPAYFGRQVDHLEFPGIHEFVTARFGDYLKQPFLSGQVPGYLTDTSCENLKLLTTGSSAYDPITPAFEILMDGLARRFDVVVMDCPPVALTSPTRNLSPIADGVLMVVRSEGYDVQIVQQAKQHLVKAGAKVLGVVLTQVNVRQDQSLLYYYGAYRR